MAATARNSSCEEEDDRRQQENRVNVKVRCDSQSRARAQNHPARHSQRQKETYTIHGAHTADARYSQPKQRTADNGEKNRNKESKAKKNYSSRGYPRPAARTVRATKRWEKQTQLLAAHASSVNGLNQ
jgi:hypothetical protein